MLKGLKSDVEMLQHLILDPSTSDLRSQTNIDTQSVGHPMESTLNQERPVQLKVRSPTKN